MKKLVTILAIVLVGICSSAQTYYNQINYQSYDEPVNINFGNGYSFIGTKHTITANGQVFAVSYRGSALFPDGGRVATGSAGDSADANVQFTNGTFWQIEPNGELYEIRNQNGKTISQTRIYRNYIFDDNNCIVFPKTAEELQADEAYYNPLDLGSSASPSSGSSDYDRHTATCRGCNSTGKCGHCKGLGYVVNYSTKCGVCHGTGRCQSCAGTGKIHGNF